MISVKIEGLTQTVAAISGMKKQVEFAAAMALTKTAAAIKQGIPGRMDRELDRPTPFSKGGVFVRPARRDSLTAEVGFMARQSSYMKYQIEGGTRMPGGRGIKLPGNIELNSFGNIPKGMIDKLKAAAKDGTLGKAIARRLGVGNRRKGAAPIQLFFGKPEGRRWANSPIGIWRRVPGNPGKLIPVIVFERKPAHYKPRFMFEKLGAEVVSREWERQFAMAFEQAIRTAR